MRIVPSLQVHTTAKNFSAMLRGAGTVSTGRPSNWAKAMRRKSIPRSASHNSRRAIRRADAKEGVAVEERAESVITSPHAVPLMSQFGQRGLAVGPIVEGGGIESAPLGQTNVLNLGIDSDLVEEIEVAERAE